MQRVWIRAVMMVAMVLWCAACGERFPKTDPDAAASGKRAVVFLLSASLDSSSVEAWRNVAQSWRQKNEIAYEWHDQVKALDEPLLQQLGGKPVDRVLVIGNDLLPQLASAAASLPALHWVGLQSGLDASGQAYKPTETVQYRTLDRAAAIRTNNAWVQTQLATGASIQWVTKAGWPVPAEWAPSEEADHIVDLDVLGDTWFAQLAAQAHTTAATQIVVCGPLQTVDLNKIRSLRLPVTDLYASLRVSIQWSAVASELLDDLSNGTFKPGSFPYSNQEASTVSTK